MRYEDDEVIVFDNVLDWARVMLLAVPKQHRTQTELWTDLGTVGRMAAEEGARSAPEGFRLLSNFGVLGMQSQAHGHVHIISGIDGSLRARAGASRSIVDLLCNPKWEVRRTPHTAFYDARSVIAGTPLSLLSVPADGNGSLVELWANLGEMGADIVATGWSESPSGFRLISNFPSDAALPGGEKGHVHLLGGAFLGHYI